uniref:Uncharacterized protein n=1 Tax=Chromera velia CCMP2878 TaxID=1169474 RepID=A0A0G4HIJ0_9ALVE|eukprot:Cvel_27865.t1-p1 / transcript=Cvel_27865.t1 / gene=Cvel_27865 / organism=Chromera_velia_CCMP2878 / gene_product=hypothetical protein / transcript_product=hypothetical protein / location=Cvel_scaffold3545:7040-11392(+) / protein_length=1451 / sequence_SO=supercontig / SO=protein_coding / is_pseudo=false
MQPQTNPTELHREGNVLGPLASQQQLQDEAEPEELSLFDSIRAFASGQPMGPGMPYKSVLRPSRALDNCCNRQSPTQATSPSGHRMRGGANLRRSSSTLHRSGSRKEVRGVGGGAVMRRCHTSNNRLVSFSLGGNLHATETTHHRQRKKSQKPNRNTIHMIPPHPEDPTSPAFSILDRHIPVGVMTTSSAQADQETPHLHSLPQLKQQQRNDREESRYQKKQHEQHDYEQDEGNKQMLFDNEGKYPRAIQTGEGGSCLLIPVSSTGHANRKLSDTHHTRTRPRHAQSPVTHNVSKSTRRNRSPQLDSFDLARLEVKAALAAEEKERIRELVLKRWQNQNERAALAPDATEMSENTLNKDQKEQKGNREENKGTEMQGVEEERDGGSGKVCMREKTRSKMKNLLRGFKSFSSEESQEQKKKEEEETERGREHEEKEEEREINELSVVKNATQDRQILNSQSGRTSPLGRREQGRAEEKEEEEAAPPHTEELSESTTLFSNFPIQQQRQQESSQDTQANSIISRLLLKAHLDRSRRRVDQLVSLSNLLQAQPAAVAQAAAAVAASVKKHRPLSAVREGLEDEEEATEEVGDHRDLIEALQNKEQEVSVLGGELEEEGESSLSVSPSLSLSVCLSAPNNCDSVSVSCPSPQKKCEGAEEVEALSSLCANEQEVPVPSSSSYHCSAAESISPCSSISGGGDSSAENPSISSTSSSSSSSSNPSTLESHEEAAEGKEGGEVGETREVSPPQVEEACRQMGHEPPVDVEINQREVEKGEVEESTEEGENHLEANREAFRLPCPPSPPSCGGVSLSLLASEKEKQSVSKKKKEEEEENGDEEEEEGLQRVSGSVLVRCLRVPVCVAPSSGASNGEEETPSEEDAVQPLSESPSVSLEDEKKDERKTQEKQERERRREIEVMGSQHQRGEEDVSSLRNEWKQETGKEGEKGEFQRNVLYSEGSEEIQAATQAAYPQSTLQVACAETEEGCRVWPDMGRLWPDVEVETENKDKQNVDTKCEEAPVPSDTERLIHFDPLTCTPGQTTPPDPHSVLVLPSPPTGAPLIVSPPRALRHEGSYVPPPSDGGVQLQCLSPSPSGSFSPLLFYPPTRAHQAPAVPQTRGGLVVPPLAAPLSLCAPPLMACPAPPRSLSPPHRPSPLGTVPVMATVGVSTRTPGSFQPPLQRKFGQLHRDTTGTLPGAYRSQSVAVSRPSLLIKPPYAPLRLTMTARTPLPSAPPSLLPLRTLRKQHHSQSAVLLEAPDSPPPPAPSSPIPPLWHHTASRKTPQKYPPAVTPSRALLRPPMRPVHQIPLAPGPALPHTPAHTLRTANQGSPAPPTPQALLRLQTPIRRPPPHAHAGFLTTSLRPKSVAPPPLRLPLHALDRAASSVSVLPLRPPHGPTPLSPLRSVFDPLGGVSSAFTELRTAGTAPEWTVGRPERAVHRAVERLRGGGSKLTLPWR